VLHQLPIIATLRNSVRVIGNAAGFDTGVPDLGNQQELETQHTGCVR